MLDRVVITTNSPAQTQLVATRLLSTLYVSPSIICLFGEVGAGKTTFMQGFTQHVVEDFLPSPTYNLEHRYLLSQHYQLRTLVHIDLYRLNPAQAEEFWQQVDTDAAVCCIEWPSRLEQLPRKRIEVHIQALPNEQRRITIEWHDVPMPTELEIQDWRMQVALSPNVIDHCERVATVAKACSEQLIVAGTPVRSQFVHRAGQLHDLLRFIDFKTQQSVLLYQPTNEQLTVWESIKDVYGVGHEQAAEKFLIAKGYAELGWCILPHGGKGHFLHTIEQKILYYSDKRVVHNAIVTIDDRYQDMIVRYNQNVETPTTRAWLEGVRMLEAELAALGLIPNALGLTHEK